jgi:hypothetical protein
VSVATVNRWLGDIKKAAGIDVEKFRPRSVRAASTSIVLAQGLSVCQILKKPNWSNTRTFRKLYSKTIDEREIFQIYYESPSKQCDERNYYGASVYN